MTDPVLYQFGHAKHYTNFSFQWSQHPPDPARGHPESMRAVRLPGTAAEVSTFAVNHSVLVTNKGSRTSDVVVLAFVVRSVAANTPLASPLDMPLRKLFGFERLAAMKPGESRVAYFESSAESLGVVDGGGQRWLHPGQYRIECGSVEAPVVEELLLVGTKQLVESNSWAAGLTK
jgi:hypothetical protein